MNICILDPRSENTTLEDVVLSNCGSIFSHFLIFNAVLQVQDLLTLELLFVLEALWASFTSADGFVECLASHQL